MSPTDPTSEWEFTPSESESHNPDVESGDPAAGPVNSSTEEEDADATAQRMSPKHEIVIAALVAGCTQVKAAARADVDARTVRRWQQDPQFSRRLQAAQEEQAAEEKRRRSALRDKAMATLEELLESPKDTVRLGAAKHALDIADRGSDAEINARLSRLEAHQEEPPPWIDES